MRNDFQAQVGHKFQFRAEPMPQWNGIIDCEVQTVEPGRCLAYTWDSLGVKSVVTFTLTPTPRGVLLRMEQSGFREDQQANYQGANYGWQKFLGALDGVVARL